MLTQAVLAALLVTGAARCWEVLAAQVSIGAGAALARPALTGLVAEIVAPQGRQSANAPRGMLGSLAMVSGPALAGVAIALGGLGAAVAFDAASYAASALLLISLGSVISTSVGGGPVPRGTVAADLRAGWAEFSTRTWLWVMVGVFAAVNLFVFGPFEVLGADTANASLGGAGAWSAILAAFGFGSLAGAVLAPPGGDLGGDAADAHPLGAALTRRLLRLARLQCASSGRSRSRRPGRGGARFPDGLAAHHRRRHGDHGRGACGAERPSPCSGTGGRGPWPSRTGPRRRPTGVTTSVR